MEKLNEWTKTQSLLRHARSVEIVMQAAAAKYAGAADAEQWGITGLLHDADYEAFPEEHPARIVAWLREQNEPALAQAVAAHATTWDVPRDTPMDKSLMAFDELTGFIVACCQVRSDGILSLTPSSVRKKLKDKSFAAKVNRGEVHAGCALLGVELEPQIQFVIDALRPHASELRIAGESSTA